MIHHSISFEQEVLLVTTVAEVVVVAVEEAAVEVVAVVGEEREQLWGQKEGHEQKGPVRRGDQR